VAVVVIVLALLAPSLAAGYSERNSPAAVSFSFPVSFGSPPVPGTVGAQGIQGVPVGVRVGPSLGPGQYGATGAPGCETGETACTGSFGSPPSATVTITVENGTAASHVAGNLIAVALENVSSGRNISGVTGVAGTVVLTVPEGWYVLWATGSSSWISAQEILRVRSTTFATTVYLIPVADGSAAVNNPASSSAVVWASAAAMIGTQLTPGLTVELLNVSAGYAQLASAITLSNGTAEFTHTNPAYSYAVTVVGWNQSLTNVRYALSNMSHVAVGAFVGGLAHATAAGDFFGPSSATGTVTGSALPAGPAGAGWALTQSTSVAGGILVLSTQPTASGTVSLSLSNLTLIVNYSALANAGVSWSFDNVSVVLVHECAFLDGAPGLTIKDTTYLGSGVLSYSSLGATEGAAINPTLPAQGVLIANLPGTDYGPHTISGTFQASEILNSTVPYLGGPTTTLSRVTLSHSYVEPWNPPAEGTVTLSGVLVSNSELNYTPDLGVISNSVLSNSTFRVAFGSSSAGTYYVNNSYLNISEPPVQGQANYGFVGGLRGFFVQDQIRYVGETWQSWATFYAATPAAHRGFEISLPAFSNVSRTLLDLNDSNTFSSSLVGSTLDLFQDVLLKNNSLAIAETVANTSTPAEVSNDVLEAANLYANYTTFEDGTLGYVIDSQNGTLAHDLWPWTAWIDYFQPFQFFPYQATLKAGFHVLFANDTFGYFYNDIPDFNASLIVTSGFTWNTRGSIVYDAIDGFQDSNIAQPTPREFFNVSHVTFDSRPTGSNVQGLNVGLYQGNVTSSVSWCLFANNEAYDLGPGGAYGRYYAAPYTEDILVDSAPVTLAHDWFLGLSNATVPILSGSDSAGGGSAPGSLGTPSQITLTDDHFFYAPNAGANRVVLPGGELSRTAAPATPKSFYPVASEPLDSGISYEAPLGNGTSLAQVGQGQYVSNTSILQKSGAQGWLWSYSVAPDVSLASGTPVVSYANGLEAGPQPNFFFGGYNYTESVEPTYVELGASSTHAPSVFAGFSGLPPYAVYQILGYAGTGGAPPVSNVTENTGPSGSVSVAFLPSSGLGNETFSVSCVSSCSGGMPPTNSAATGVPLIVWIALAAVLIAIGIGTELGRRKK
jgi:hypothetical protein